MNKNAIKDYIITSLDAFYFYWCGWDLPYYAEYDTEYELYYAGKLADFFLSGKKKCFKLDEKHRNYKIIKAFVDFVDWNDFDLDVYIGDTRSYVEYAIELWIDEQIILFEKELQNDEPHT